ncbi:hypothetical protein EVAR_44601_1 [Eumeta japonica]|uniref:Uncharacterized protein n=1 Tax=Eumeta variegata TaxID=151549 RepID=A0A4C1X8Y0_EUMVA|nr:hypothetical protein EVAR_44601_1 [Eumeta japonica]
MNSKSVSGQVRLAIHIGTLIPTLMYGSETGYGRRKMKVGSMHWRYDRCVVCVECLGKIDVETVMRPGKPCLTILTPMPASVSARSLAKIEHSSRTCGTSWTLSGTHAQYGESLLKPIQVLSECTVSRSGSR